MQFIFPYCVFWSAFSVSFESHCSLHFTTVTQTEASSWTVTVPSSVKGLPGSCVVIPCSFNYPDPGKTLTQFTGMWTDMTHQLIYHPVESKMMQQYRNRTELLGDRQKSCSLKIDPLQQSDQGPFYFRIEIANYDNFSYKENRVSIAMISKNYFQQPSLTVQLMLVLFSWKSLFPTMFFF